MQIRYDQGLAVLIIGRLVRFHSRASCLVLVHEFYPSLALPVLGLCVGDVLQPGGVVRHPTVRRAQRNAQREHATDLNPRLAIRSAGVLVHVLFQSIHELAVLIFGTCHCQAGIIRRKTLVARTVQTCSRIPWVLQRPDVGCSFPFAKNTTDEPELQTLKCASRAESKGNFKDRALVGHLCGDPLMPNVFYCEIL